MALHRQYLFISHMLLYIFIYCYVCRPVDPAKKLEYFMATGNLVSPTGLDLMQATGFTVVADKLNFFRYVSHFRYVYISRRMFC